MMKMKWMKKPKPELHMVSLSGGKDSTAMLLRMIEEKMQIDLVIFCDTGLEFPAMYEHLQKIENDTGIKITRICSNHTFEHFLLQHEVMVKYKKNQNIKEQRQHRGYGWSGPLNRWCTKELKDIPRERFLRSLKEKFDIIEYVGIAADEGYRLERKNNKQERCRHPLVEWNMTEKDCLQYCYDRGYTWDGLYERFSRVSCWCCPLQPLAELRVLYKEFPELWEKLKSWDNNGWRKFKAEYTVEQLQHRFDFEDKWIADGKKCSGKEFHTALKEYLEVQSNDKNNYSRKRNTGASG